MNPLHEETVQLTNRNEVGAEIGVGLELASLNQPPDRDVRNAQRGRSLVERVCQPINRLPVLSLLSRFHWD